MLGPTELERIDTSLLLEFFDRHALRRVDLGRTNNVGNFGAHHEPGTREFGRVAHQGKDLLHWSHQVCAEPDA